MYTAYKYALFLLCCFGAAGFCFTPVLIAQPCKEVVGYYPGWQWYDRAQLVRPATIDYSKYTIINYAFFAPDANGNIAGVDAWGDENLLLGQINWSTTPPSYYPNTSLIDLAHNHNVKVLVSIGGWTLSNNFPGIAADAVKRQTFAQSCVTLLQTYGFDGIDLDWEYPGYAPNSGTPADKQNFTLLLQAVRSAIDAYGASVGQTFLLSAAVSSSPVSAANVEWGNVSQLLDMINLMSYDYFGTWDPVSNHNSPLYAPAVGAPAFNLNAGFQMLTDTYGVPSGKINIGVAFYGRSFKQCNGLHQPHTGADTQTFWQDEGTPQYYNILNNLGLFTQNWDAQAQVPYLSGSGSLQTVVSYDNPASIALKAQYAVNNNARGVIIWEITGDYLETAPNSGIIAGTPLADTLNAVLCSTLSPQPDITIPTATANPITLTSGSNTNLSCTVANIGNMGATATTLSYYLSSNATFDATDVLLATSPVAAIAAGSNLPISLTLTMPASTAAGVWYIVLVADSGNALSESNENNNMAAVLLNISTPSVSPTAIVNFKLFLEGAYNTANGLMSTALAVGGYLPDDQPYNTLPWNYTGSEMLVQTPLNATDWVLVEARSAANPNSVAEQRAAILLNDGRVQDADGMAGVKFYTLVPGNAYFFVVRHRNHLAVITAAALSLTNGMTLDFSAVATVMMGSVQLKAMANGVYTLIGGDMNADGVFSVADFNRYQTQTAFINGYFAADVTLDGSVTIADFNFYRPNSSAIGVVQIRY